MKGFETKYALINGRLFIDGNGGGKYMKHVRKMAVQKRKKQLLSDLLDYDTAVSRGRDLYIHSGQIWERKEDYEEFVGIVVSGEPRLFGPQV